LYSAGEISVSAKYYHDFSDYKAGFGLIIGFNEPFDTAGDYTLQFTVTHTSSLPLLGSGFQRRTFTILWFPELSPYLSYQLLTAKPQNY
jgi:hypothetical protein